jgi:hypothetical protein
MKKYSNLSKTAICVIIAACMTGAAGCSDTEDQGREAAAEFCKCAKTKTENKCLDELKSKYSHSTYTSTVFIDSFNEAQTCGVKLYRENK